jgi:hypothetical protein
MWMKLQFVFRHASQLYRKFERDKQVAMKTASYESLRVTIMLCTTAKSNALILLPHVIHIKKKESARRMFFFLLLQKRNNSLGTSGGCVMKPRSMLAMDAFGGHLSDRIRKKLRNRNFVLVIIPSGLPSQLQPLDVSINNP